MIRQFSRLHKCRLPRYFIIGSTTVVASANYSSTRATTFLERKNSPFSSLFNKDEAESSSKRGTENKQDTFFDNAQAWTKRSLDERSQKAKDFWNKIVNDTGTDEDVSKSSRSGTTTTSTTNSTAQADFTALAGNMIKLFGSSSKESQEQAISDIVAKARETASKSDISDERSFVDLLAALNSYKELISSTANKYISNIDLSKFEPTALFYYLEYEDERKNPSWKRRKHRFYDGIEFDQVEELNDYLDLARISYADSVEEIKTALEQHVQPCELLYAEVVSEPGKPANFVALPRNQRQNANHLEVIIGVRGTKSLADAITDLICQDTSYRGGKAHSFILNSGKFVAQLHLPMLTELLENSGKSKLKVTLVGHSLGAGGKYPFNHIGRIVMYYPRM